MAKFRKKPVVIEAVTAMDIMVAAAQSWKDVPEWAYEACVLGTFQFVDKTIQIKTLEGTMTAQPDDFIIKGVNGEFYPCKPDIFEKTYEAVEESTVISLEECPFKYCDANPPCDGKCRYSGK